MLSINTQVHSSGLFSFPIISAALKLQTPLLPRCSLIPLCPCHYILLVALLVDCSLPGSPSPTPDVDFLQRSCLRVGSSFFILHFCPFLGRGNAIFLFIPSPNLTCGRGSPNACLAVPPGSCVLPFKSRAQLSPKPLLPHWPSLYVSAIIIQVEELQISVCHLGLFYVLRSLHKVSQAA